MPKLTAATQAARREHILDAAERCFAQAGFHRTTMQHICKEAGVSAGALYVYFTAKEALIAGIAQRYRTKLAAQLAAIADATDLATALGRLGEHYAVDEPLHKRIMCIEIGIESTRNATVGAIYHSLDAFLLERLEQLFARAADEGRIKPDLDPATLARLVAVLGDGLLWRRAVDPGFDGLRMLPVVTAIIGGLLKQPTVPGTRSTKSSTNRDDAEGSADDARHRPKSTGAGALDGETPSRLGLQAKG